MAKRTTEPSVIDRDKLIQWVEARSNSLGPCKVSARKIQINSPWYPDKKFHCALIPSMGKFGGFKDYKSGKSGTVVRFISEMDRITWKEAAALICKAWSPSQSVKPTKPKPEEEIHLKFPKGSIFIDAKLIDEDDWAYDAAKWLKKRGLLFTDYEFYLCTEDRKVKQEGVQREYTQRLSDRILVPIRDASGDLVHWVARTMNPNEKVRYQEPYQGESKIAKDETFFAPSWDFEGKTLMLIEGVFCVLSIFKCGFYAASSMGARLSPDQARILRQMDVDLVIAYDNDEPGKIASLLATIEYGRSCKFVFPPQGHDWNSAYVEYGQSWITDFISRRTRAMTDTFKLAIESTLSDKGKEAYYASRHKLSVQKL